MSHCSATAFPIEGENPTCTDGAHSVTLMTRGRKSVWHKVDEGHYHVRGHCVRFVDGVLCLDEGDSIFTYYYPGTGRIADGRQVFETLSFRANSFDQCGWCASLRSGKGEFTFLERNCVHSDDQLDIEDYRPGAFYDQLRVLSSH